MFSETHLRCKRACHLPCEPRMASRKWHVKSTLQLLGEVEPRKEEGWRMMMAQTLPSASPDPSPISPRVHATHPYLPTCMSPHAGAMDRRWPHAGINHRTTQPHTPFWECVWFLGYIRLKPGRVQGSTTPILPQFQIRISHCQGWLCKAGAGIQLSPGHYAAHRTR